MSTHELNSDYRGCSCSVCCKIWILSGNTQWHQGTEALAPGSVQTLNSVGLNIITANTLMSFHIYTKCFHAYSNRSMQTDATICSIAMHSCTTNMSRLNYVNIRAEQGLSRQMERQTEVELKDLMRGFITGFQDLFGSFEQWSCNPVLHRVD